MVFMEILWSIKRNVIIAGTLFLSVGAIAGEGLSSLEERYSYWKAGYYEYTDFLYGQEPDRTKRVVALVVKMNELLKLTDEISKQISHEGQIKISRLRVREAQEFISKMDLSEDQITFVEGRINYILQELMKNFEGCLQIKQQKIIPARILRTSNSLRQDTARQGTAAK